MEADKSIKHYCKHGCIEQNRDNCKLKLKKSPDTNNIMAGLAGLPIGVSAALITAMSDELSFCCCDCHDKFDR